MSSSTSTPYTISSHILGRQVIPHNSGGSIPPSASPPLILAFLAIGIFALSMIGVFGWRRLQYTRVHREIPRRGGQADQIPSQTGPGPRPKLWDLWTTRMADGHKQHNGLSNGSDITAEHETWDTIMPISVAVSPPYTTKGDGTTSQTLQPAAVPFHRWARHIHPPATAVEKGISRAKIEGNNGHDERQIQVAVAISMPCQPLLDDAAINARVGSKPNKEGADDIFAYTLGVYECAWGHDNG
ncbi:hypothetical protein J132_07390 [Termitomyces sp. J132]|nr:hypothetical protein H2248_012407 [Termitomyces sp. 'cryptogamus']KNZ80102.1 hypothetical protein J132_07390 [Termitomyces sp. J132]